MTQDAEYVRPCMRDKLTWTGNDLRVTSICKPDHQKRVQADFSVILEWNVGNTWTGKRMVREERHYHFHQSVEEVRDDLHDWTYGEAKRLKRSDATRPLSMRGDILRQFEYHRNLYWSGELA